MAKRKKEKVGPEQKLIKKLAKEWAMLCECSDTALNHLNGPCIACNICQKYTPILSVELIEESTEVT